MFRNEYVRSFLLLWLAAHHVVCISEKSEHFNHRSSSVRAWETKPQIGPVVEVREDKIDYLVANHSNQGSRSLLIKPANNQIHASSNFHQSPSIAKQVPHQINSKAVAASEDSNNRRNQPQQDEQLVRVRAVNRATSLSDRPSSQTPSVPRKEIVQSVQPSNLELALRQVSGDESLFQPSSAIVAIGHQNQFDWFMQPTNGGEQLEQMQTNRKGPSQDPLDSGNQSRIEIVAEISTSASVAASAFTTANVLGVRNETNHHLEPFHHLDHHLQRPLTSLNGQQQLNEQQQPRESPTTSSPQTTASSSIEFNNQVIYEGPVTPPVPTDNYYFSSSEKLPSNNNDYYNEHANSNAWWAIGVGDEFERVGNLTRDNYRDYCDRSPLLNNNKQRSLCRLHPRVMQVVARGLRLAIEECQKRFVSSRWNCSLILNNDNSSAQTKQIFGDVMKHPNRERSFLNALSAAAIAHAMTKACRQGELPEECGCDRKIKSTHKGRISWIGCSDDIDYGAKFSRDFTDNFDGNEVDATRTIYLHNSEVGRRVFKSITDITCNCLNSDDGLCTTKRCWKHMGSFSDVVDQIMDRYESATHVRRSDRDPQKLRPVRRGVRKPKRKDLVYIDESPDYCQQDLRIGVLGTHNRVCNSTSQGPDSCSLLCCGRGFQNVVEHIEEDCNCKFVWCCQVKCEKCIRYVTNEKCN